MRMCACSGKNGFAHIGCLEKKAAKSVEDAVNKRGPRVPHSEQSWARWNACPLCGAEYVGQLSNALGWACWRTYCRRTDEADWQLRFNATGFLARGLYGAERYEEANRVFRARLGMYRRRVLGNVSQRGYELETCQQQLQILNNIAYCSEWKSNFGRPTPATRRCSSACVCSMAWRFNVIDATLFPRPRRLDGVEAHEGPRKPSSLVDVHAGAAATSSNSRTNSAATTCSSSRSR